MPKPVPSVEHTKPHKTFCHKCQAWFKRFTVATVAHGSCHGAVCVTAMPDQPVLGFVSKNVIYADAGAASAATVASTVFIQTEKEYVAVHAVVLHKTLRTVASKTVFR